MAFSEPAEVVKHLPLREGMMVADFGAGSGAYTLALAASALLGSHGRIYAIDVQKELLSGIADAARTRHLSGVEVLWGNVERLRGTTLKDDAVDLVLVANLLFQVEGKYTLALEAKRILRPGGFVAVIDWTSSFGGLGPAPTQVVAPAAVKEIFAEAGFTSLKEFPAGDHHYGLLFTKAESAHHHPHE